LTVIQLLEVDGEAPSVVDVEGKTGDSNGG
jgi:hypothetical protein